ncbi:MAG: sigma 54-interacting transcriptional regulator [Blastocatellia bacterium]
MRQFSASSEWEKAPGFSAESFALPQSLCQPSSDERADQRLAHRKEAVNALTRLARLGEFPPFVITSCAMLELIGDINLARDSRAPILITGETGTGKELLALAAHALSSRRSQEFMAFNCAESNRELFESRLFGHQRGSFTGADANFKGVIREADGGTLLLDEIGELSPGVQSKLLRFLQEGEVHPVGAPRPVKTDLRVIAATNRDLEADVRAGRFRADLFERLNVVRLHVPPLRERREEIPLLIKHFMERYQQEEHRQGLRLSDEAAKLLTSYDWPYNVRQLANEVRSLVIRSLNNEVIGADRLPPEIKVAAESPSAPAALIEGKIVIDANLPYHEMQDEVERLYIAYGLRKAGGNLRQAAARMKMNPFGLSKAMRRLGIKRIKPGTDGRLQAS